MFTKTTFKTAIIASLNNYLMEKDRNANNKLGAVVFF